MPVPIEAKLETVDGYTIVDIEGVERLIGPVRSAKKVLQRTTVDLIRHVTYAAAAHEINASGAAAALNHDRTAEDQSPIGHFRDELAAWAETHNFTAAVTLGLSPDEVGQVLHAGAASSASSTAASAVGCVDDAATSIVVASKDEESELLAALGERGATLEPDLTAALTSGADAVFVRGKTGVLDHAALEHTNVHKIIGLQPLTTTARGLAVASRAGAVVIPDFVSAAGPYLTALGVELEDIGTLTTARIQTLSDAGTNSFVAACERAEDFLATLTDALPFGRPLAP